MSTINSHARHLIVEMRYAPNLSFYGVMDKIGMDFAEEYPDWERSALTLELRNKEKKRRCLLASERCFFEAIDLGAEPAELERARKLLDKTHHELKFTKVSRFGIRRYFCVPSNEPYPQMVRTVAAKFTLKSPELDRILRGRTEDSSYSVEIRTDGGWRYHLRIGPMHRRQWFEVIPHEMALFPYAEDFVKYRNSVPKRMYFIDLDCYQEDITFSDIAPLITSIQHLSVDLIADLIRYLDVKGE